MTTPKYKIGQELKDTLAMGDCIVKDIFHSTTSDTYVYSVEEKGQSYFCGYYQEPELQEHRDSWTHLEGDEP